MNGQQKYSFTVRVAGILIENGKILLVKQKVNDKRNWSLPGGKLERGETLEKGIIREMKEETGLDVEIDRMLCVCDSEAAENTLLHISFLLRRVSGNIRMPSNEHEANPISDIMFIPICNLTDYGFSERFLRLAESGFSGTENYSGDKKNIGL